MKNRKFGYLLLFIILMLAAYLRIYTVIDTNVYLPLRADAGQYFSYAYNLRFHHSYSKDLAGLTKNDYEPAPDHLRNPGYPLLLMPFVDREVTGLTLLHITLFQAVISLIAVMLTYQLARRALPEPAAWLVALLTAMSPHLININVYILSEADAGFTTLLLFWGLAQLVAKRAKGATWVFSGILLALATLVRPSMQWFILPLAAMTWLLPDDIRQERRQSLVWMLVGFLMAMSPWWIRNLIAFGEFSDSSLMIVSLQHGMYPDCMYDGRPETFGFPYRFDPRSAEIAQSLGTVLTEILRRFQESPMEHLRWFLLGKPVMFWDWSNDAQGAGEMFIYPVTRSPYLNSFSFMFHYSYQAMRWLHDSLVILGMLGSLIVWFPLMTQKIDSGALWILRLVSALLLYFVVLHMIVVPLPRYSIPILPLLYLQASATLVIVLRWGIAGFSQRFPSRNYNQP
ncbi:PMT_2 domain-containing protein [Gammaproteobacteria bacterium]